VQGQKETQLHFMPDRNLAHGVTKYIDDLNNSQ